MNLPLLHPAIVHYPIGLYFFEMLLLIFWMVKKEAQYKHAARLCFQVAYGFTILSLITGFIEAGGFDGITGPVRPHAFSAVCVAVLQTFRAFHGWFHGKKETVRDAAISVGYAVAAYTVVLVTGYFGGVIVYAGHEH